LAEFGRLRLPLPQIWAETRDYIDVPMDDAPSQRVEARFAIAAAEDDGTISFWGFAEISNHMMMSALSCCINSAALAVRQRHFEFIRPPGAIFGPQQDEAAHRRISRACGERLLELLFLLSTDGVARDTMGAGPLKSAKLGKRRQKERTLSDRDYTIIRVPMHYITDGGREGSSGHIGRWVRPHVRKGHLWGINTRPKEEQQWWDACLVGAAKLEDGEIIRRPEYYVGLSFPSRLQRQGDRLHVGI
jgi:hypothetical protein